MFDNNQPQQLEQNVPIRRKSFNALIFILGKAKAFIKRISGVR